jgi:hypothetical protein
MKYISILLVLILLGYYGKAQEEPSALRVSLITCTPGAELYSVFGHNALRIVDSAAGTDIAYNFGTFNFNDPDFYTKFVLGKLQYYLSQENFNDFLNTYQYFKRGVSEQLLNLNEKEKKEIQRALFENLTEENRYYKYDFFYDNCSTRLRDIIFKTKSNQAFTPPQFVANGLTFRDHLHTYLDRAEMKWTRLGIDLILGLNADRKMSVTDAMFIPEYLAKGVNATKVNGQNLVVEENTLIPDQQPLTARDSFLLTPFFIFLIISILMILPLGNRIPVYGKFQNVLQKVVFISSGLLGLLMLFLWIGTDHQTMTNNLNLFWAFPLHLVLVFKENNLPGWLKGYSKIYSALVIVLLLVAVFVPGLIAFALYPLMIAMAYRTWEYSKKTN